MEFRTRLHGGIKESGLGREQGMLALASYSRVKAVGIRL
jgi:acyl-CoA reductase-like NAD-dependent aldehyde dehydrogenase